MVIHATLSDFTCIESHPYGVLPGGNIYLDASTSSSSNNAQRRYLSDELWQQVLSFCDGASLAHFVQTCRRCYVAGHQPELWRDLVLRDLQGTSKILHHCGPTWKDTFVHRQQPPTETTSTRSYVPMAVRGVFSDFYYRTHLCQSFQIPDSWLQPNSSATGIERLQNISIYDFFHNYEVPNVPLVLIGAASTWKATQKWTSLDYLATISNGRDFRATSGAAPLPAQFTIQSYAQYSASTLLEESPLYLFDRTALLETPLHLDFFPDLQRTCPYFDPANQEYGHDLFSLLGEGQRPDHTWLILGPKRSGSSFHMDPNATHAWNAAIVGRKRWIMYPPGVTPPGVHPSPNGDHVAMPISIGEWILNYWTEHVQRYKDVPSRRPMECTVEPGDVMFVPHGWWHMVINLDDVNIAVTHNYVSQSNLATVLRFLQKKVDQISGCRDRKESIKPEMLYSEFCKVLRERHPVWLQKAQEKANTAWPCLAWTDDAQDDQPKQKQKSFINGKRRRKDEESSNSIMAKAKKHEAFESPTASSGFSFSFL